MTVSKKIVYGSLVGLEKSIKVHQEKGWKVTDTGKIPRGNTGRYTYIAYLEKENNGEESRKTRLQGE